MYPKAISHIKELKEFVDNTKYVVGEKVAEVLVTLPTHSYVTDKDLERNCEVIEKMYRNTR